METRKKPKRQERGDPTWRSIRAIPAKKTYRTVHKEGEDEKVLPSPMPLLQSIRRHFVGLVETAAGALVAKERVSFIKPEILFGAVEHRVLFVLNHLRRCSVQRRRPQKLVEGSVSNRGAQCQSAPPLPTRAQRERVFHSTTLPLGRLESRGLETRLRLRGSRSSLTECSGISTAKSGACEGFELSGETTRKGGARVLQGWSLKQGGARRHEESRCSSRRKWKRS